MKIKFPTAILILILAMGLAGCSSPSRVAEVKPTATVVATEKPALKVDAILTAFPECSKERAVAYKSDSILTFAAWGAKETQVFISIAPNGKCVDFVEIDTVVTPGGAEKLTDKRLEPLKRLLSTLFPEWDGGLVWLRETFKKMPYTEKRDRWALKVWESSSEGALFITATQDLRTEYGKSSMAKAENGPREFEKLAVTNGQSVVTGASVGDGNGEALTRQSSELLGIWVSSAWYRFTDVQKKYFIKIYVDAFNEWKGDDKGIVIVFDSYLKEEVGSGTSRGITLKK